MSDLISRAEVTNIIQEELSLRCGYEADISLFSVKKKVSELNTAFNTEKVVEQLEEKTDFLKDCTKYGNKDSEQQEKSYSTMMMYEIADLVEDLIDIVKKGGVE